MIEIEELTGFPRKFLDDLADFTKEDFKVYGLLGFGLGPASDRLWRITLNGELLLYAGVQRKSLMSKKPELWLMLGKGYEKHLVASVKATKMLREKLFDIYPGLYAKCRKGYPKSVRFAKLFGFVPVGEEAGYIMLEA